MSPVATGDIVRRVPLGLVAAVSRSAAQADPQVRAWFSGFVGGRVQDGLMLLADVVTTSAAVAATRSRLAKVRALAELIARAGPAAVEPVVAFLAGAPRQGRTGTGFRTLYDLATPPAAEPGLTVERTDAVLEELSVTSGKGSAQRRSELLTGLFAAATGAEQEFLRRLLTGELRQGALEGVMLDAIAAAAGVGGAGAAGFHVVRAASGHRRGGVERWGGGAGRVPA
ncbi:hypothetical protein GCM10029964_007610 [Kibdelosporangium lantanae]